MPVYTVLGQTLYGGQCQQWVELVLLGHAGVYADPVAAMQESRDATRTPDPNAIPAGVEVCFAAAPSNEGLGHGGVSLGGGQMKSVWSDGSIRQEAIAQFAIDNNAPLLGWQNFGRGAPAPGSQGAAVARGTTNWRQALVVGAAIYGAYLVVDALTD